VVTNDDSMFLTVQLPAQLVPLFRSFQYLYLAWNFESVSQCQSTHFDFWRKIRVRRPQQSIMQSRIRISHSDAFAFANDLTKICSKTQLTRYS